MSSPSIPHFWTPSTLAWDKHHDTPGVLCTPSVQGNSRQLKTDQDKSRQIKTKQKNQDKIKTNQDKSRQKETNRDK